MDKRHIGSLGLQEFLGQECAPAGERGSSMESKGARAFGMRTAFIVRPLEFGPLAKPDTAPEPWFDFYAGSFLELADLLGA